MRVVVVGPALWKTLPRGVPVRAPLVECWQQRLEPATVPHRPTTKQGSDELTAGIADERTDAAFHRDFIQYVRAASSAALAH